jgi:hypothetical protein
MTIEEILTAAENLREAIRVERKRSGELHMASALHMTDRYLKYMIGDLERHKRNLDAEEDR